MFKFKNKTTKLNPHFNPRLFVKYYAKRLTSFDWKCFAGLKPYLLLFPTPINRQEDPLYIYV